MIHNTITYHLKTDAQPVPEQQQPPSVTPVLLLSMTPHGKDIPGTGMRELCRCCPLPAPRAPQPLPACRAAWEAGKSSALLSNNWSNRVLTLFSSYIQNTAPSQLQGRKLTLAQLKKKKSWERTAFFHVCLSPIVCLEKGNNADSNAE